MSRYLKGYYIFNFLLISVYPVMRAMFHISPKLRQLDTMGYTRESGIVFTGLALLFVLWRKSTTTDHFFSNLFFVGKLVSALLLTINHTRIGMFYLLGCVSKSSYFNFLTMIVAFLFFKQPKYSGPSKMIKINSEQQFEDLVLKEHKSAKKLRAGEEKGYEHMNMWLVEFYADWADSCIYV